MYKTKTIFLQLFFHLLLCISLFSENYVCRVTNPYFLDNQYFDINENWTFYPNKLIYPSDLSSYTGNKEIISLPHAFPSGNYGTYTCRIENLLPNQYYAISIYDRVNTSIEVFCNGSSIYKVGKVGETKKDYKPQRSMKPLIFLSNTDGYADLVFHVSNYDYTEGGIIHKLYLSSKSYYEKRFTISILFETMISGLFIILMLYFLFQFIGNRSIRVYLNFSILAIILLLITDTMGFSLLTYLIPGIPFQIEARFILIPLVLPILLFVLYICEDNGIRLKEHKIKWLILITATINSSLLFLPIKIASEVYYYYYGCGTILLILSIVVLFKNLRKKPSNYVNLLLLALVLIACIYTVIEYNFIESPQRTYIVLKTCYLLVGAIQTCLTGYQRDRMTKELTRLSTELIQLNSAYYRFVPRKVMTLLNVNKINDLKLGMNTTQEVMLLSSDIRNFTGISEGLNPDQTFKMLSIYYEKCAPIIREFGGFIEKFIGDGILAIFPTLNEAPCLCAIKIQNSLIELRKELKEQGLPEIKAGIGIHAGIVDIGIMGTNERLDAVAVSESIQEVTTVESYTKKLKTDILISQKALKHCRKNDGITFEGHLINYKGGDVILYKVLPNEYFGEEV